MAALYDSIRGRPEVAARSSLLHRGAVGVVSTIFAELLAPLFKPMLPPDGVPGFTEPSAARIGRAEDWADGPFLHFCSECGAWGAYGYGINLRATRLDRCTAPRIGRKNRSPTLGPSQSKSKIKPASKNAHFTRTMLCVPQHSALWSLKTGLPAAMVTP
jgi:hypothetical protein